LLAADFFRRELVALRHGRNHSAIRGRTRLLHELWQERDPIVELSRGLHDAHELHLHWPHRSSGRDLHGPLLPFLRGTTRNHSTPRRPPRPPHFPPPLY